MSQTFSERSKDDVSRYEESGENAAQNTDPVWPVREHISLYGPLTLLTSHTMMMLS